MFVKPLAINASEALEKSFCAIGGPVPRHARFSALAWAGDARLRDGRPGGQAVFVRARFSVDRVRSAVLLARTEVIDSRVRVVVVPRSLKARAPRSSVERVCTS